MSTPVDQIVSKLGADATSSLIANFNAQAYLLQAQADKVVKLVVAMTALNALTLTAALVLLFRS